MTKKRRKRHSPEQIVRKLQDAETMLNAGQDLANMPQMLDISDQHCQGSTMQLRWPKMF